jgi:hypothetical protein
LGPLRRKKCTHIAQFFIFLSPPKFYIQVGKLKIESFYHDFYRVWRKQPEKKLKQIVMAYQQLRKSTTAARFVFLVKRSCA